jgi:protein-histidine N-methyltransferase
MQLMAEDDSGRHGEGLVTRLEEMDIKPAVYEGGFKTWACSIDLAKLLIDAKASFLSGVRTDIHIIEVRVYLCWRERDLEVYLMMQ